MQQIPTHELVRLAFTGHKERSSTAFFAQTVHFLGNKKGNAIFRFLRCAHACLKLKNAFLNRFYGSLGC